MKMNLTPTSAIMLAALIPAVPATIAALVSLANGSRIDQIDHRLENVEDRLEHLEGHVEQVDRRLQRVEDEVLESRRYLIQRLPREQQPSEPPQE